MPVTILFDDTEGSGWCVALIKEEDMGIEDSAYGYHAACDRSRLKNAEEHKLDIERWSWFIDDTHTEDGIKVCFECSEPVPEHIQALVVLHHE